MATILSDYTTQTCIKYITYFCEHEGENVEFLVAVFNTGVLKDHFYYGDIIYVDEDDFRIPPFKWDCVIHGKYYFI